MAATKHIAGNAIEHDTSSCWWDTYTGTAEALIEAGLVRADQLPGLPGVNKTMRTFAPDGRDARKGQNFRGFPGAMQIIKKGRRFVVNIAVGEDEHERRLAEQHTQIEAEREQWERDRRLADKARLAREAGMTLEQWVLRGTPSSEHDHRTGLLNDVDVFERIIGTHLERGYGYALEAPTRVRLRMLFEAMRKLIAQAPVSFDQAARDQAVKALLEKEGVPLRAPRPTLRVVK